MQLMNAMGYQGIFEAAQHKLGSNGGVMLWKLNAAFPSVVWQIYDWYLQPNAGYYFMQKSCDPLHVQLNLNDSMVAVVNRTHHAIGNLSVDIAVYNMNSELDYSQTARVDLKAEEVKPALSIAGALKQARGISFILLKLKDANGHEISRNTYWLVQGEDYAALQQMPRTRLDLKVLKSEKGVAQTRYMAQLTNPSKQVAFFTRLQLMAGQEEILPSFWTGNYLTLAPGESVSVNVSVPTRKLKAIQPEVKVSGWNVEEKLLLTGL